MILKKLVLTNIKSYVSETIDFSNGINCILGLNGSGKSTIIESIGIGLFNYCKTKTIGDVLRYNETKGSIEIEFVAEDNVTYKVIRNIKPKSNTVKIIDVNSDVELYSGVSDVYSFIKSVLKVSNNKEFSKMFEEIIAVPQGQYVSAFLAKSSERKDNFDKLFELHIYKDISQKLKNLTDNVNNNKIAILKEELANIEGRLVNYDIQQDEAKRLNEQIKSNQDDLLKCTEELAKLTKEKDLQMDYKNRLDNAKQSNLLFSQQLKNLQENLEELNKNITKSSLALEVIKETEKAYKKYTENQENIVKYELDVKQLNQLILAQNNIKIESAKKEAIIKNISQQISEKKQELEEKKNRFSVLNQEELFDKNNTAKSMEKYLEIEQNFNKKTQENLAKKEQNFKQKSMLEMFKKRYEKECKFDVNKIEENKQKIIELDAKNEAINNSKEELKLLAKKEATLLEKNKTLMKNAQMAIDGKCPIFHTKCLNVDEGSLNVYFDKEIAKVNEELANLKIQIEELDKVVSEESDVLIRKQRLENDIYFIQIQETSLKQIYEEVIRDFEYHCDDSSETLASILKHLELQLDIDNDNILQVEAELKELKNSLLMEQEKVNSNRVRDETKKTVLENLDKEMRQLNSFILLNNQTNETMNKELEVANKELQKISNDIESLQKSKILLEELKEEQQKLENDKNKYIANLEKANELLNFQNDFDAKNLELIKIQEQLASLTNEIKHYEELYSKEKLEALSIDVDKYLKNKTTLETLKIEYEKRYAELVTKLQEQKELLIIKNEKNTKLNEYLHIVDFLVAARAIYKDLPAKLSKTYREYLSKASTILYRQISGENVRLNIAEDYRVDIVDDLKPNNTKYMEELSGGEQMSVALAIRLAMLKHIAGVDIYFLDEPTINLDYERREKVAEVVKDVSNELSQLFVISHDDTFESITANTIKIEKTQNISGKVI